MPAIAQNVIVVTDAGAPTSSTCTLAQAIGLANSANFVDAASVGSATTDFGSCQTIPPLTPPPSGPYTLLVGPAAITLTTIDNYWYGPNALPPIASTITIVPTSGILKLVASHVGDPTPATANAFRFFYVSGGLELPAGSLTVVNSILQGGYAKGGDSGSGGGGAGMGGAIFNQGSLVLTQVSLIGDTAQGGSSTAGSSSGGGMGQDGGAEDGGGFGGTLGSSYGGNGSVRSGSGGSGAGGGFVSGSDGGIAGAGGAPGGGKGALGGAGGASISDPGGAAGDGGGGGASDGTSGASGGRFGSGGSSGGTGSGGGGVGSGGGGGGAGGGGGFGGGGGDGVNAGSGGFGGGAAFTNGSGGFGGGYDPFGHETGGAGIGGAIFNHRGTVSLLNVTAIGNAASGGAGYPFCSAPCVGSGLGAVLFNLNGNVTIDFSTLGGNTLSGNNARSDSKGPEDGTVYSLAYGNKIEDGTASSATLTIRNSIIHGTQADGGQHSDVSVNVVDGANTNTSSLVYAGKNFIDQSYTVAGVTQSGTSPNTADPLLGALSIYSASPNLLPVLPIGSNSPAFNAASSCLEADNSTTLTTDERGAARPFGVQCDVGAYEFDGDYIFSNSFDVAL